MIQIARILSIIFHPVIFILLLPYLVIYKQTSSQAYALKWELFTSLFIMAIISYVLYGKRRGVFSDDDISKREQRRRFYFISWVVTVLYFAAAIFFRGIFFPLSLISFMIVVGIMLFIFVNNYLKASIHIAVSCAFIITLGLLYGEKAFFTTVWIIPVLSWSRVTLKSHTIQEEIVGGIIGTLLTLLTYVINVYLIH